MTYPLRNQGQDRGQVRLRRPASSPRMPALTLTAALTLERVRQGRLRMMMMMMLKFGWRKRRRSYNQGQGQVKLLLGLAQVQRRQALGTRESSFRAVLVIHWPDGYFTYVYICEPLQFTLYAHTSDEKSRDDLAMMAL